MTGKVLGKIDFAEYGTIKDYPFMIGVLLGFKLGDGTGIMDGGKYTVNIGPNCEWKELSRADTVTTTVEKVYELLKAAKVNYVSELVGKPVEVTIEGNWFKDFRILTEVL